MQILHFNLRLNKTNNNYVELRYCEDNLNVYQKRSFALTETSDLIQLSERDYYVPLPEDYRKTGTTLFNWLDGGDRFFQQLLDKQRGKGIVLAISAGENLAHLPWELLHDGKSFLVEKRPGIIPVRWVPSDKISMLGQLLAYEKQDFTTALDYLQQSLEILLHLKSPDAEKVKGWIFEVLFYQLLYQSPEAQQLHQQLESADEDTRNQIISRLGELINEFDNG